MQRHTWKTPLRSFLIFLFIWICLSMGSCQPGNITPTPGVSRLEATPLVMNTPEGYLSATTPPIEGTPNPTLPYLPTNTLETPEDQIDLQTARLQSFSITIVYDNYISDSRLSSAWGFSALIEAPDHTLLFDTGGDGQILMGNMRILGIEPAQIDSVMLSHAHDDHTAGLITLLNTGIQPTVYLLPSFSLAFKRQVEQYTQIIEVIPGQSFADGFWTTGQMGTTIPEQALILRTSQGLVIITGCAHPGIVEIVEQARSLFTEPIHLVLGGFHLGNQTNSEINAILADFRRMEVEFVAPSHCSGDTAISMFATEYGENFVSLGVGRVMNWEPTD